MKERGISQYALYTRYGISTSFLDKLRHNENVEIRSLDILCSILKCDFGDIVEHIPDETRIQRTIIQIYNIRFSVYVSEFAKNILFFINLLQRKDSIERLFFFLIYKSNL